MKNLKQIRAGAALGFWNENKLARGVAGGEFHYEAEDTRTSLRGLIAKQCQQLKTCFEQRIPPRPFIMN